VIISKGGLIDLSSAIPVDLGVDGRVIPIELITYKYLLRVILVIP